MKNLIIKVLLTIVIIGLAYLVYESVMEPVRFNKERDIRKSLVVQNLKDIRNAQMAYKSIYNKYTQSFDTLLEFINNGEIPVVKMIPDPNDTTFTKSIKDTIAYINVKDSLFSSRNDFKVNKLAIIPFSEGDTFKLEAGEIDKGNIMIQVFEASALNLQFLKGLNEQLILNYNDLLESSEQFPGLKVGSMVEASTDGNWE